MKASSPKPRQISDPEMFYDRLEPKAKTDIELAYYGLSEMLEVPRKKIWDWLSISNAMIAESDMELFEDNSTPETVVRVVGLMREYPWLQGFSNYDAIESPISLKAVAEMVDNHIFGDHRGLWSLTVGEAVNMRRSFQEESAEVHLICEELGIVPHL